MIRPDGPLVTVCPWCLSTPPHHDRCEETFLAMGVKLGTALDSVGATVPVYERIPTRCTCTCRCDGVQEPLL